MDRRSLLVRKDETREYAKTKKLREGTRDESKKSKLPLVSRLNFVFVVQCKLDDVMTTETTLSVVEERLFHLRGERDLILY